MVTLNPYLGFNGNCKEAFDFYKLVFGGEFDSTSTFKDMPEEVCQDMNLSENDKDKIMHISLPIGNSVLMGCDVPHKPTTPGDNVSISIQTKSEEETKQIFEKLSKEGTVNMPLAKTFWNATFGVCTDKFGIHWMVNYDHGGKQE